MEVIGTSSSFEVWAMQQLEERYSVGSRRDPRAMHAGGIRLG